MPKRTLPTILIIASVMVPLGFYILLSLILKTWIIDDAGISFAYSRSFANGDGLVAQPGAERVEGYSNFLWVLILTPFFLINAFDPVITPKIISWICVGFLFYFITKICLLYKRSPISGLIVNSLITINAPFIIWTNSGLENPLYVLLIGILLYTSIQYTIIKKSNLAIAAAIIGFLISITRPDGILFSILFPIAILTSGGKLKKIGLDILLYCSIIGFLLGALLLFRWFYFHDVLPNTYYAKNGSVSNVINEFFRFKKAFPKKYHSIFLSMGGMDFVYIIYSFVGLIGIQLLLLRKNFKPNYLLFFVWFISFLIYILMPYDWMGYHRFATPFIVITNLVFFLIAARMVNMIPKYKVVVIALLLTFLGIYSYISFQDHHKRLLVFIKTPTMPFELVKKAYAEKFNEYAATLNIKNGSILLPDVGATYYYSNLRVYDSAGLCDKTIARGKYTKNRSMIIDYVFNKIKPTFIHLHDGWSEMIRVDDYSNFRNEYIPIFEIKNEEFSEYYGVDIYSGDYIRKDAVTQENKDDLQFIIEHRYDIFF